MDARRPATAALVRSLRKTARDLDDPGLVSVYLFGSHAANRAHRESDLDIGVLLSRSLYPSARERFERGLRLASLLGSETASGVADLLVLNDVPPTLGRHVVITGQRVFCSDPEADHGFVRDVQLLAADLEPFLRRTRRLKLDAIAR